MGIKFSKMVKMVGVGLYVAVTRTIMTIAVVFTALFFILNSSPFPDMIARALVGVIPGYFEFGRIQVSPIPWIVDVTDVAINTPKGKSIITSDLVRVRIKLLPLLNFVLHPESKLLKLHFASVRLDNFNVLLQFDDDYNLELVEAFDPPGSSPPRPDPLVVQLQFDTVIGTNGHVFLEFPEWDLRVDGIDMKTVFNLKTPPIGILVQAEYFNYLSGIAHIKAAPGVGTIPRTVQLRQGFIDRFVYNWDEISFDRFRAGFDFGSMDAADGYLSWGNNLKYTLSARLDLPDGSHAVRTATKGLVSGPLVVNLNGQGDAHDPTFNIDLMSPALGLDQLDLGRVDLSIAGGRDDMGVFSIHDVDLRARAGSMKFDLTEGVFRPSPPDASRVWDGSFSLDFSGLDVSALLKAFEIPVKSPAIPVPGVVDGNFKVDASAIRALTDGPANAGTEMVLGIAGRVGGTLGRSGILDGRSFLADIDADVSWRDIGKPTISLPRLRLRSGRDEVSLSGMLDLATDRLAMRGHVAKDLGSLAPLIGTRLDGFVDITALNVRGSLSEPTGSAKVRLDGFAWQKWKVIQASADVSTTGRVLKLSGLRALAPFGQISLESATVPVAFDGRRTRNRLVEIREIVVNGLDLSRIPPMAGTGIDGFGHARARSLSFDYSSPLKTLTSRIAADLSTLEAAGRSLETVSIQGALDSGRVTGLAVDALVTGGGNVTVSGSWDLNSDRLDLVGGLNNVPLKVLLGLGRTSPIDGRISVDASMRGKPSDPAFEGSVRLNDLMFRSNRLSPVRFSAARDQGGDLFLSSDKLFGNMKAGPESRVTWKDGGFRALKIDLDIRNLSPQDIFPDISTRKLAGGLTARMQIEVPSFTKGTVLGTLESPPDGLWVEFFNRQARLENRDKLLVRMEKDGTFVISGVRLDDGASTIALCGVNTASGVNVMVKGSVGAHWLRAFKGVFSSADGMIDLMGRDRFVPELPAGCDQSMREDGGALLISGELDDPIFDGTIRTGNLVLNMRGLGDPVRIDQGGRIVLSRASIAGHPATDISIPEQNWIAGLLGEGVFNLSGRARLDGGRLEDGLIKLNGSQLRYVSSGEFFIVAEPRVEATFSSIRLYGASGGDRPPEVVLSGQVDVSDGSYHRNFNVVRRAFSGMTGDRVAQRSSKSVMESVPWLGDAKLNVAIRAPSFGVRTRLVVGQTDLDLNMNLRLLGTLRYPELWDRIEVVSGGTFTYDVVRREFEVTRGTVDFDGDLTHPQIDLMAKTRIEYKNASDSALSASRFSPDDSQDSFYSDMIQVNLAVSGTYPDLDIQITSPTRGLSQNDLQVMLLTGMAPGESISDAGGSFVNVNLLTGGVTDSLVKVLLADLVDSVSFGVTAGGDVNLDVSAHMGRRLKFQTQVQQGSGSSQYSTGFKIRLTEGLSLEGRLRAVEYSVDQEDVGRNYDTKLRYRIPIE